MKSKTYQKMMSEKIVREHLRGTIKLTKSNFLQINNKNDHFLLFMNSN